MSSSNPGPSQEPTPKLPRRTSGLPNPPVTQPATQPHHPLLIVTLVTFLLLIPLLMTDLLPLRLLFFLAGAGTVGALHPRIRGSLSILSTALSGSGPGLSFQLSIHIPRLPNPFSSLALVARRLRYPSRSPFSPPPPPRTRTFTFTLNPRDILLFLRRLVDNDKLDDAVWNAPLADVELWENERWVKDTADTKRRKSTVTFVREGDEDGPEDDGASSTSSATVTPGTVGLADGGKGATGGTWSKANLKPNERVGWTRGRDGWSGVGGEVRYVFLLYSCLGVCCSCPRCSCRVLRSSNLTFSLSPGWAFVETEGWRPDVVAAWAVEGNAPSASICVGADEGTHPRSCFLSRF